MTHFVLKRLVSAIVVMFFVSMITFIVLKAIPGNPAELVLGTEASPQQLALLEESMGLNEPLLVQYFNWIGGLFTGNWGQSYVFGEDVLTLIVQRLPVTFSITIFSMVISIAISLILGILSALHPHGIIDSISRTIVQIASSVPAFWSGMILLIVFASMLNLFPVSGYVSIDRGFLYFINSITLPSICMAIGECGILIRQFRSSMLSALNQDYMIASKVKGLPYWMRVVKYALRSALITPITVIGNQFAKLFGGTVIVENIFALPGIGRLLLTSVERRDIQLLQGIVIFICFMVVLVNFITEVVVMMVNPMIRLGLEGERE